MRRPKGFQEGIVELWPTVMVEKRLRGARDHNDELAAWILAMERSQETLTTDYRDVDLFNIDHPPVNWLRQHIQDTTIEYLRWLKVDYPVNWVIQGWANVNRLGDYHDPHNHPRSYLSGTYYVSVPKGRATPRNRADVRPGCITFYDPRPQAPLTAIAKDPYVDPDYTVAPEAGMLLMWPSFLMHFVHPNLADEPRVSISFNIVLRWSDGYLPKQ